MRPGYARISPTAHYTGYVWYRNGLSYRGLTTLRGLFAYRSMSGFDRMHNVIFRTGLEALLLARHTWIDARVVDFLSEYPNGQVVELAAGLTPRGTRLMQSYPLASWWETDLPDMVRLKKNKLYRAGLTSDRLQTAPIDVFATSGMYSLNHLGSKLHKNIPVLMITEGLVNYFPTATIEVLWHRLSAFLKSFPSGRYLSGVVGEECTRLPAVPLFRGGLMLAARGANALHYHDATECRDALLRCGFRGVKIAYPDSLQLYRMVQADV